MAWTSPRTWVTSEVVTAAHMNAHVRDNLAAVVPTDAVTATSWTPTMQGTTSNDSLGTVTGRRWRVGPLQFVWMRWVAGGGSEGGLVGTFFVTLPVAASGVTGDPAMGQVVGSWGGLDSGTTANSESGVVYLRSTTTVGFRRSVGTNVSDTSPFTWAINDILTFQASYPVA